MSNEEQQKISIEKDIKYIAKKIRHKPNSYDFEAMKKTLEKRYPPYLVNQYLHYEKRMVVIPTCVCIELIQQTA